MKKSSRILKNIICANLICFPVLASELVITPAINAAVTATNNVNGTDKKESESFLTQITPSLNILYDSSRVDFEIEFSDTYYNYSHNSNKNGDTLDLNAIGAFKITESGLSAIMSSHIFNRSMASPDETLLTFDMEDNVQVEEYEAGFTYYKNIPSFKINSSIVAEITKSEDELGEREGYKFDLDGRNGRESKNILWRGNTHFSDFEERDNYARFYDAEVILGLITNYNINPFIRGYSENAKGTISHADIEEINSLGLGVNFKPVPSLNLFLSYNKNLGDYAEGEYGSAVIEWNPSDRTNLYFSYGKRFFGNAYGFNLSHQSKRLKTTISYNETLNAFDRYGYEEEFLGYFWCPNSASAMGECSIKEDFDGNNLNLIGFSTINPIKNKEYILSKKAEWTSELELHRTKFTLYGSYVTRDYLTSKIEDIDYTFRFDIKRDLNNLSSISTGVEYRNSKYDKEKLSEASQSNVFKKIYAKYERQLNSSSFAEINIQHRDRDSSRIQHDYSEARLTISYTKEF